MPWTVTGCNEDGNDSALDASTDATADGASTARTKLLHYSDDGSVVGADSEWSLRFPPGHGTRFLTIDVGANGDVWVTGYTGCCRPTDVGHLGAAGMGGGDATGNGPLVPQTGEANIVTLHAVGADRPTWSAPFEMSTREIAGGIANSGTATVTSGQISGVVSVAGQTVTGAGARDIVVILFDAAGMVQCVRRFGGAGDDRATAVAMDDAGSIGIGGTFEGTINFDGRILTSGGALTLSL